MTEQEEKLAKEAYREYMRKYRAANKEKIREYHRNWKKNNPEKVKANTQRYWLKKAQEEL